MTEAEYFSGYENSHQVFKALRAAIEGIGPAAMRVTKSQVAFRRRRAFAWAWIPEKYLHRKVAPLVLTVSFPHRDASPRWKSIVEAAPGRFTHHLELHAPGEVDQEVRAWLQQAWQNAGAMNPETLNPEKHL